MKQEDYFRIMDCASDEDITEMMQHRRFRQTPSDAEEITMKQTEQNTKKEIRMSRRGVAAGTAVAAALLALNVGGGYLLLHGKDAQQAASVPESTLSMTEQEEMPQYCRLMQEFYAGSCQEPCNYDFTGLGMDLNETWENDEYKITVNAVAGCDWLLYYFYDVEPKQGQSYEAFWNEARGFKVELSVESDPTAFTCFNGGMPGRSGQSDDGVWHCVGLVCNSGNNPFFTGEQNPPTLSFGVHFSQFVSESDYVDVQPTFSAAEYMTEPYEPTDVLDIFSDQACIEYFDSVNPEIRELLVSNLPVNSFVTPFGIFCRSNTFETEENQSDSPLYMLCQPVIGDFHNMPYGALGAFAVRDAEGNLLGTTDVSELSSCGGYFLLGKGVSSLNILFRKPLDLSQGTRIEHMTEQDNSDTKAAQDAQQPQYVQRMQEYYTLLTDSPYYEGKAYEPCDYDFTGLGKDIGYTFEWDDYKMTYRAVVGCDWVLYYFFDVEPKKGQSYEQMWQESPDMRRINVSLIKGDTVNYACDRMEHYLDPELHDGVWHGAGTITNCTDQPFFRGENAGTQISICESYDTPEEAQQHPGESFAFETKEFPLFECAQPVFFRDETHMSYEPAYHEEQEALVAEHPLTRCAETPFGRYYVSDKTTSDRSHRQLTWIGPSLGLEGIAPRTLDATYFGDYHNNGEEIAHLIALYDRPVEAETAE